MLKSNWIRKSLIAVSACAVIAGCGTAAGTNTAEQQEQAISVQVAEVVRDNLSMQNQIFASAGANAEVNVMPKLSGELLRIDVEKNMNVQKGDTLAVIDHETLSIQLKMEQFAVEQALEQYRDLHTANASQTQLDQALRAVEQARLRLQLAEINEQNAFVTAPISGVVVDIHAKPGEVASPGAPLFRIVSLDPVRVTANVSTRQMMELSGIHNIEVEIPDLGKAFNAAVTYVSQVSDASGLYTVEAEIANPQSEIKPGMTAVLLLEETLVSDGLIVPTEAIVEQAGETFVFKIDADKAVKVPVEILESQSELSAVNGELEAKDRVVVKGQMLLSDGQSVSIVEGAQ